MDKLFKQDNRNTYHIYLINKLKKLYNKTDDYSKRFT